jgi:mannose-6-phosphate isomerase-like protein (cupin superfamily)
MMSMMRKRTWGVSALSIIVTMGCVAARAQAAPASSAAEALTESKVYAVDQLPANKSANGTESRNVLRGTLETGESVAVHESVQPVGAAPVALHAIQHSELIVVREGELEFDHDEKAEKAGPGDVIYVVPGTVHRVRNVGTVPAKYVVVAIGGDTKK